MSAPKTNVYIDGFNLYFGCLRDTSYRWLDLQQLCQRLLPNNDIQTIKYFTARVSSRPSNPSQHRRQEIYLRALRTLPDVEVIFGHFLTSTPTMRLVNPPPKYAKVHKTEEKGSDVNIAAHLLSDAYEGRFEAAALITNDSDLLTPIKMVKQRLNLPVGVISPFPRFARVLDAEASFKRKIRTGVLAASQFPATLQDAKGTFHKPKSW